MNLLSFQSVEIPTQKFWSINLLMQHISKINPTKRKKKISFTKGKITFTASLFFLFWIDFSLSGLKKEMRLIWSVEKALYDLSLESNSLFILI